MAAYSWLVRAFSAGGTLEPGSDVDAAVWADVADLSSYDLAEPAMAVIARGYELAGSANRSNVSNDLNANDPNDPND